jgi:MFS family permease
VAAFFTLAAPIEQLMPDIANEHSDGALAVGLFLGAIGLGAIVANPILSRLLRGTRSGSRTIVVGLAVAALGLFICGISPDGNIPIDVVALMLVGAGWEFVFVSGQGTLSVDIPADIRGSMIGLFFVLVTATTALGALLIGLLFDQVGVNDTPDRRGRSGVGGGFRGAAAMGTFQEPARGQVAALSSRSAPAQPRRCSNPRR